MGTPNAGNWEGCPACSPKQSEGKGTMTKLEQCLRLVSAISEGGTVSLQFNGPEAKIGDKAHFYAQAIGGDKCAMAKGDASTLDGAVAALHLNLGDRAARLRDVLDDFEDK